MSQPQVQSSGAKPKTSYVMPIIAGLIALALLAFVLQNTESVTLHWLFWSFSWPLWLLLVVTIVLSLVAGQIMLMWRRHRRRVARRDARRD
jgi:uncharacterized integral membrane protein